MRRRNFLLKTRPSVDSDRQWVSCSYFFGGFRKVVSVPIFYSIFLGWILWVMSRLFIIVYVYILFPKKKKWFAFHIPSSFWLKNVSPTNPCMQTKFMLHLDELNIDFLSVYWIIVNRYSKPCFLRKPFLKNFKANFFNEITVYLFIIILIIINFFFLFRRKWSLMVKNFKTYPGRPTKQHH